MALLTNKKSNMGFDKFFEKINKGFYAKDPVTNLAKAAEEVGITHNAAIGSVRSGVVKPIPEEIEHVYGKGYMTRTPGNLYCKPEDIQAAEEATKQYMDEWRESKSTGFFNNLFGG